MQIERVTAGRLFWAGVDRVTRPFRNGPTADHIEWKDEDDINEDGDDDGNDDVDGDGDDEIEKVWSCMLCVLGRPLSWILINYKRRSKAAKLSQKAKGWWWSPKQ